MATPSTPSKPRRSEITPIEGSASTINEARTPPTMMNGRLRPFHSHTLSLTMPISTWPMIPASGPAAQTMPMSWISRPYSVERIQLNTEICTDNAKPMAVAGSVSSTRKGVDSLRCMPSIVISWRPSRRDR